MAEQKLFGKRKETNCNIMFLVKYQNHYRLMSFKSNPWLSYMSRNQDIQQIDNDVYENSLFVFSSKLKFSPSHCDDDGIDCDEAIGD